uniref:Uncharacterized protein n=1 Tax=Ciona savignyi TaxID=51511 RepID=H2ZKD9_CIOSA
SEDGCNVFKAIPSPPSQEEVLAFVRDSGLDQGTSKEPFYSNAKDVQTASRLTTTLPIYVKRPKIPRRIKDLEEFKSNLPPECSINSWRVVLAADLVYNGRVHGLDPEVDIMEAVTNLGGNPSLEKQLIAPDTETIVTPAQLPPT